MKIILYFGHHKVGSTALQAYLARNALALLQHDILYPAVESEGMSHLLALALGRNDRPPLGLMNFREPHNALGFRMLATKNGQKTPPWHGTLPGLPAMMATIRHQAAVLKPHTLILCSEVFSNFGLGHKDLITKLHSFFPEADWELYCALRRPDEHAASWFGQRLRFGHKLDLLSSPAGIDLKSPHFEYRRVVEPWAQEFKDGPLHIRNYNDILSAGGSVQDFTTTVTCAFPEGLPQKGPSNKGLPRSSYEILRQANHALSSDNAQALREYFLSAPKDLSPVRNQDIELFGPDQRQKLYDAFAPIHAYLSKLTGQAAFFPDIEDMRNTRPVSLQEATRQLLARLDTSEMPTPEIRNYVDDLKNSS